MYDTHPEKSSRQAKIAEFSDSGAIGALACPACHTSPSVEAFAALSAPESARAIELKPLNPDPLRKAPRPGVRGAVRAFSPASRRRLLWTIAQVDEGLLNRALFVTLTYPADDPSLEYRQRHLDTLLKRLRRFAPEASVIWKLEYTKRNTPHYHLIVLNLNFWSYTEVARAWSEIVGSKNAAHARAGTQVQRVGDKSHVGRYITKYVSKAGTLPPNHQGRVWGTAGALQLSFAAKRVFVLARDHWSKIRRALDQVRRSHQRSKAFARKASTYNTQRWFAAGAEVIRYMRWLGVDELSLTPT